MAEELRLIRQLLEQQSRQIDTLTKQIDALQQRWETAPVPAAVTAPAPSGLQDTPPAATPVPGAAIAAVPPPSPTPPGRTHTVASGETLTSIAKMYGTTVAELLEANTIEDDRKLQIGQVLIVPQPAAPQPPIEDQ